MAQGSIGREQIQTTEDRLTQHWMLDEVTAAELAQGISLAGHQYIDELADGVELAPTAVSARDEHRAEIGAIFRGDSERQLVVIGPCSLDTETDYANLFDYVGELQNEHNDALIALRANGSKPRTSGGWGGLVRSTDPAEQKLVVDIYQEAFERDIPILTEVTDRDEFGALAPYLSAAWIGARDMESTALRSLASATRLPFAVKNGTSGNPELVANAVKAIRKGTADSEGSGVNLGMLGYTYRPNGVGLPAMVEVGGGNPNVGIVARGYELPKDMPAEEKTRRAIEHLSHLCTVAADMDSTVLIDGSHGVPPMFEIARTEGDRFPRVMERIHEAIERGEIAHADRLRGYIGEISTTEGRTDKNWLISQAREPEAGLSRLIRQPLPVSLA